MGSPVPSPSRPSWPGRRYRMARCWRANWATTSLAEVVAPAARVTMRPEAIEMSSAGICDTRPSPTVSRL